MKRCMYCGHENDDTAQACVKCGNHLLDMPAADTPLEEVEGTAPAEEIPTQQTAQVQSAVEAVIPEEAPLFDETQVPDADVKPYDVQRGQTYAAQQQVQDQDYTPYDGRDYGYTPQADAQQDYTGQGYGYGESNYEENYGDEDLYTEEGPQFSQNILVKSRRRVKSFLFFLATLLYTVATAAQVANVVMGNTVRSLRTSTNTLTNLIGTNSAIGQIDSILNILERVNSLYLLGAGILLALPSILICLGLWIAFIQTSVRKEYQSTSGLTLVKVIEVLKFIFVCLTTLGVIAYCVAFVVAAAVGSDMMTLIIGIILTLIAVLFTVFMVLYFVQLLYSLKVIKRNVKAGEDKGRIPGFIIFVGFLMCLTTVATMLPMAPDDYIGLAAKGTKAASMLLISLWAVVYRAVVKIKS